MRWLQRLCLVVLASGLALGQANTATNTSSTTADELKALREAIAQQQKQIAQQQQQLEALQKTLDAKASGVAHVEDAALRTTANESLAIVQDVEKPKESPLSFRIGGADFTPGGFVEFQNIFRTTNTGNVSATSYNAIPFSNTVQGHLTEDRMTAQYSRVSLKVGAKYGANNVTGYLETDFSGNDAGSVFVSSNSHTLRLRLYWVDLRRGKWEFLGGQTWSLLTPNRVGLSPNPADMQVTLNDDQNLHVGIQYTRAAEFRAVYHFNDRLQFGIAAENSEQYAGNGAEVTFPSALNAQLTANTGQFDSGANPGVPNMVPDAIVKMAYDRDFSGKHFHIEAGGVTRVVKDSVLFPGAGSSFSSFNKLGGGAVAATNVEFIKGVRLVASGMWGAGVGRYSLGLGPDAVVRADGNPSLVHEGNGVGGFEFQLGPKTQIGTYYGGTYFSRNLVLDTTVTPNKVVGFGFPNSSNVANKSLQEGTVDLIRTMWKNPQYGALMVINQASYVTRAPWFVAAGAPKNAHLFMDYLSLRYVLP